MKGEDLMGLSKLLITAGGASVAASPIVELFTQYVSQPVWGIPVTVFGAAAAGACMSLFFGDPLPSRRALYGQVMASTLFGAAAAVLAADAMDWDWAAKNISIFALVSAALIRWFLPSIIDRVKQLIKEFRFSFTKKDGEGK